MMARLTIRQQLLIGLLAGSALAIAVGGIATYTKIRHEADELFDYQLKQIVRSFPPHMAWQQTDTPDPHPGKKLVVQVWDGAGRQVYNSNPAHSLPKSTARGFVDMDAGDQGWRVYSEFNGQQLVQVGQVQRDREKTEAKLLWRCLAPFLLLLPVLALLIWLVVGKSLKPLERLASGLRRRSADDLAHMEDLSYSPEIIPIVGAINGLFDRLEQAMQAQKRFTADAAHELRTPLAALKLQLQLAEKADDEAERNAAMKKLHERLNRAIHLVQQLLTLSRQGEGGAYHASQSLSLRFLAEQAVSDFAPLAEGKDIDLGLEVQDDGQAITGNAEALRVMLGNVVDNAIRYTPRGGKVDVVVGRCGDRPSLIVNDSGGGIPAQERERVFDRFYRREGMQESGSGLGLAIVKNVAHRHGAVLRLDEGPDGRGLSFSIAF